MNQNENSFQKCLQLVESLARQGKRVEVLRVLNSLNLKQIPRNLKEAFAEISWRNQAPMTALRILSPVVRSDRPMDVEVSQQEKIVYATSLINIGVTREAHEILSSIDSKIHPEVLLRKAFAFFGEWNYRDSLPLLRRYCQSSQLSEYQRIVGKVNLIAAQISCDDSSDLDLLSEEVLESTEKNDYRLLQGNLFELLAQRHIFQGNLVEAKRMLKAAEKNLAETQGLYYLFVRKWKAVVHALEYSGQVNCCEQLKSIRLEALKNAHWEVVRDCDLFVAVSTKDEVLFKKVIWGTPFQDYRSRALRLWAKPFKFETEYVWQMASTGTCADLKIVDSEDAELPAGLRTLTKAISADFYKPIWIGSLFKKIYPNEYFDPYTSEQRIKNLTFRLRRWFKQRSLGLNVVCRNQSVRLEISGQSNDGLKVYRVQRSRNYRILEQFLATTQKSIFSAQDLATLFRKSKRWSHQIIILGIRTGQIHALQAGRDTRYRFGAYGATNTEWS